jgi:hypothetical protein
LRFQKGQKSNSEPQKKSGVPDHQIRTYGDSPGLFLRLSANPPTIHLTRGGLDVDGKNFFVDFSGM